MSIETPKKKFARYGAAAFDPASDTLPAIFPREMGPNTMQYLKEVVDSGLASGMIDRMESYLAQLEGRKFCVGTVGCTQAIFALMMGCDFAQGDEIIMSPVTDYGTVTGALFEGYIPIFADSDPHTGQITATGIEPQINERTRAIFVVHLNGMTADMDPILALARKHSLLVFEDCCQAIHAIYKGRLAGSMGEAACFSFDAEKTCGADIGGAIVTDNEELYDKVKYRAISRGGYMEPGFGRVHDYRGFPTRIPQCTAATVLANLEILPHQIENRQKTAALFDEMLAEIPGIIVYRVPKDQTHTYWAYGFSVDPAAFRCTPAELTAQLTQAGLPNTGMSKYYLMPEALSFLKQYVAEGRAPFCSPPASRVPQYSGDSVPNARRFLETWIRLFWTEKFNESHVEYMAGLIKGVVTRNLK